MAGRLQSTPSQLLPLHRTALQKVLVIGLSCKYAEVLSFVLWYHLLSKHGVVHLQLEAVEELCVPCAKQLMHAALL